MRHPWPAPGCHRLQQGLAPVRAGRRARRGGPDAGPRRGPRGHGDGHHGRQGHGEDRRAPDAALLGHHAGLPDKAIPRSAQGAAQPGQAAGRALHGRREGRLLQAYHAAADTRARHGRPVAEARQGPHGGLGQHDPAPRGQGHHLHQPHCARDATRTSTAEVRDLLRAAARQADAGCAGGHRQTLPQGRVRDAHRVERGVPRLRLPGHQARRAVRAAEDSGDLHAPHRPDGPQWPDGDGALVLRGRPLPQTGEAARELPQAQRAGRARLAGGHRRTGQPQAPLAVQVTPRRRGWPGLPQQQPLVRAAPGREWQLIGYSWYLPPPAPSHGLGLRPAFLL
mmetsp:Transcript_19973/g.56171  ORF Transcript_19973/g.56171 Transcript_19973/m.56171 type:complete len:338 (+) Transcript_19973:1159-2172(+)